jgi:hypothetical protein
MAQAGKKRNAQLVAKKLTAVRVARALAQAKQCSWSKCPWMGYRRKWCWPEDITHHQRSSEREVLRSAS